MPCVMQQTLTVVHTCIRKTGLSVNHGKIDVIPFTRRYKWNTSRTLKLRGQQLEISERVKYLQIILGKLLE